MRNGLLFSFILLGACGAAVSPYARASAGRIGCPAEYIELSHVQRDGAPLSWVAHCGSEAYACSSNADPRDPQARIVCSEIGVSQRACHRRGM